MATESKAINCKVSFHPNRPPPATMHIVGLAEKANFAGLDIALEPVGAYVGQPTLTLLATQEQVVGDFWIARYLARVLGSTFAPNAFGTDALTQTQVEWYINFADTALRSKDTLPQVAEWLNKELQSRTFVVGPSFTVADLAVIVALQSNMRWTVLQKNPKEYPHLVRYVNYITSLEQLQAKAGQKKAKAGASDEKQVQGGSFDIPLIGATRGKVVTRFPPEPSGYLHIGHAKAALLNFIIAEHWEGEVIVRFDDTNPAKEKSEYVDNILKDLETLGVKYKRLTATSDSFEMCLKYAEQAIKTGHAYVDDTPVEKMRHERMYGIESASRSRSVEENLRLWKEMCAGTPEGLQCVLRAKIDMKATNKALRDPVLYRCNLTPHHRTGTKYKVYPTYDFACPIVDSFEGVSHALRTSEYHDRNEQYYWIIDALGLRKPHIWEYSRLNFVYTVLSKRKLQWFVDTGRVTGWDDPRFPTVQGVLRRGMTVEALREFIRQQGASQSNNYQEWDKIWSINKRLIDPVAERYTAVAVPNRVIFKLTNFLSEGKTEIKSVPLLPKKPEAGNKTVSFSNTLFIEYDDAKDMKEGEEITLMSWGNAFVRKLVTKDGKVTEIQGELNPKGNPSTTSKRITWVASDAQGVSVVPTQPQSLTTSDGSGGVNWEHVDLCPTTIVEFDTLIDVAKMDEDMVFEDHVVPQSWFETPCIGEAALRNLKKGAIIQLNRRGFFICDRPYLSAAKPLVLFFIPSGREKSMSTLSTRVQPRISAKPEDTGETAKTAKKKGSA